MDLEQFVSQTLAQIVRGIRKAQTETAESGARINPSGISGTMFKKEDSPYIQVADGVYAYLTDVQFDIAVTASDEQQADAHAKIKVLGVGLGGGGSVNYENSAVSRVQFRVPVAWPGHRDEDLERRVRENRAKAPQPSRRIRSSPFSRRE